MYKDFKTLPHDLNAECAVLGSCFIDPEAIGKIPWLKAEDFYLEKNSWVYAVMLKLHSENKPTDQIMVAYGLREMGRLDSVGATYISVCIRLTPTSVFVAHYAQIVKDCADRRLQIKHADQLKQEAYTGKAKPKDRIVL